jgi:hypothetical protein
LLKALTSAIVDANEDSMVSTDELREYVQKAVAQSTKDLQHPTVDRDNLFMKFGFPLESPKPNGQ